MVGYQVAYFSGFQLVLGINPVGNWLCRCQFVLEVDFFRIILVIF